MALDLVRSDGRVLSCSPQTNADLFRATIGGLGLTGLILRVTLQLRRVPGTAVEMEEIRFDALDDFFALSEASDGEWEYTAAWIDCVACGRATGRGLFSRARHLPGRMAPSPALWHHRQRSSPRATCH
jgi:FAD/FMN-containing dehydrogenase